MAAPGGDLPRPPDRGGPGDRLRLYDRAQVVAYLAGKPLPALPPPGEHSEDLLTDREAGDVLGISHQTVRAHATTGYLSPGIELYGRRWWPRHEIDARKATGDQRSTPRASAVAALAAELTDEDSPPPWRTRPNSPPATTSAPAPPAAASPPHDSSSTPQTTAPARERTHRT
ncbi:helix-turn-helix transcriptional regulator [Streptomyces sp. NPDC054854]